ncbi:MAG TPA: hypothetical protein VIU61_09375 [Kofleriaceae bacterium]
MTRIEESPVSRRRVRRSKIVSLERALAFEGPDIVADFHAKYRVARDEAEALFEDVKKWVWACALAHEQGARVAMVIDDRLLVLDYMWHTFVLFTREYHAYCTAIGGPFIHHAPTTLAEHHGARKRALRDPEAFQRKQLAERRRLYGFLFDHLGEDTVRRWFLELPQRYSTTPLPPIEVAARRA